MLGYHVVGPRCGTEAEAVPASVAKSEFTGTGERRSPVHAGLLCFVRRGDGGRWFVPLVPERTHRHLEVADLNLVS